MSQLLLRFLFTITLFVSAALLFGIQPMLSKMVLPLLGGVPAVWNTCLVFYQTTLLAGYLYAHLTSKWLRVREQAILHVVLIWFALFAISFSLNPTPLSQSSPILWLFQRLLVSIGLPFFALSATTPMLQRWLGQTSHPDARNPYFLYAASNLGSLLALVSYPLVVEPFLRLHMQNRIWTAGYGALAFLVSGCAIGMWYFFTTKTNNHENNIPGYPNCASDATINQATSIRQRLHWLLLSFVPSSLLLGATSHITTDIAPMPLFWVFPLCLYLLTFVLVFSRKTVLRHTWMLRAQTYLVLPPLLLYLGNFSTEIWIDFPVHLVAFFVFAMVCHGELVKSKPQPARLTEFYLWIATGGVLGGIFTALIAPVVFSNIVEYPLMIAMTCVMRPVVRDRIQRKHARILFFGLCAALLLLPIGLGTGNRTITLHLGTLSLILSASFGGAFCFYFLNTPKRAALGLGSFLLTGMLLTGAHQNLLLRKRSFFGTLKVAKDTQGDFYLFYHGTTIQGAQPIALNRRHEALTYHHREGPLGQVFEIFETRSRRSIAVFGLGVGTIATYARAEDDMTFYEIDANVKKIARETQWFTYLRDCPGQVRVVLGDARVSLSYAADFQYDMIIQDAFSSDAIPVHLLTKEAFKLYKTKLTDSGMLVFNITNRYLNLEPVLAELIQDAGMTGLIRRDTELSEEDQRAKKFPSTWVAAVQREADLVMLREDPRWKPLQRQAGIRLWTDDYSNILSVLKFPGL